MAETIKVVATNRRAAHDYEILDRLETGIELLGTEIKSIRAGQINLREGYVEIKRGQAWLQNVHISMYDPASSMNHDPLRMRRLLMHRKEIVRFEQAQMQKGLTIIPMRIYLKRGMAKVEIALARGLKKYDKRQVIKKREADLDMQRALGRRR